MPYSVLEIVKVSEPIEDYCIFLTNQHTDMHIQKADNISQMRQFGCYEITAAVKDNPHVIDGGHMFFTIFDESGEIECGAYEPTKNFRKTVSHLRSGDIIKLYGGEVEVYSRITGYYRPVKNWNDGKAKEYKMRKEYNIKNSSCKKMEEKVGGEA